MSALRGPLLKSRHFTPIGGEISLQWLTFQILIIESSSTYFMVAIICVLFAINNVLLLQIGTPWLIIISYAEFSISFYSNLSTQNYMTGRTGEHNFFWSMNNNLICKMESLVRISPSSWTQSKRKFCPVIWTLWSSYSDNMKASFNSNSRLGSFFVFISCSCYIVYTNMICDCVGYGVCLSICRIMEMFAKSRSSDLENKYWLWRNGYVTFWSFTWNALAFR